MFKFRYGLPCIAYKTDSGVCDIINNGKNGYVVKNRNENDYIKLLEKLISDIGLRKSFSVEAINTARQFYKDEIVKVWEKIIGK